jgi:type IV pilus assembly protein PilB
MMTATAKRVRLGDLLVEKGLITQVQLEEALDEQRKSGRRLGEILVESDLVSGEDISSILAEQSGIPYSRLRKSLVDPKAIALLARDKAELYEALPLFRVHNTLTVAISDPNKTFVTDAIKKLTKLDVQLVVCPREDITSLMAECYEEDELLIEDFIGKAGGSSLEFVAPEHAEAPQDISSMESESPVIDLVNQIILRALKERASDIHIEPERNLFRVRLRIDGVLYPVMRQAIELHAPVVSRLKLMANLDIAERRMPQDGRIQVHAGGRMIDLRFSSLPGIFGEKVVLRVLDRRKGLLDMSELGFGSGTLDSFRGLLRRPHGLLLVTGPTGSGKTTTLYSALSELNSTQRNIVTIEDPIEYQFELISQTQVKEEIGLTFARILRHTLRQDPDIVMVGEIRDSETAKIAVQAALTGHLVLSTMHTNDAASSVARLLEIGIEPYLLAPSLVGVLAQRLVRTICPDCSDEFAPSPAESITLGVSDPESLRLRKGGGCKKCFDSGYRGRTGVYELLPTSHELQKLILANPGIDRLRQYQAEMNMTTMGEEAVRLVLEGRTTPEETARVVFAEQFSGAAIEEI